MRVDRINPDTIGLPFHAGGEPKEVRDLMARETPPRAVSAGKLNALVRAELEKVDFYADFGLANDLCALIRRRAPALFRFN